MFGLRISAMHHYLTLKRIVKQLNVAIGHHLRTPNAYAVDASEVFRAGYTHTQSVWIGPYIIKYRLDRLARIYNTVMVVFLEYRTVNAVVDPGLLDHSILEH